jgi:hypothetical protein
MSREPATTHFGNGETGHFGGRRTCSDVSAKAYDYRRRVTVRKKSNRHIPFASKRSLTPTLRRTTAIT